MYLPKDLNIATLHKMYDERNPDHTLSSNLSAQFLKTILIHRSGTHERTLVVRAMLQKLISLINELMKCIDEEVRRKAIDDLSKLVKRKLT